ncbi:hypothetical protein JI739_20940 [Ramlibacter sp. AW1]|uniref:Lipoprotein n=1 Tax=Ramlibacter aurantiacus TaxID=2801330 RepID=A0A936ZSG7_9BURK|nr:hypothetical protein [Ramlibacter aurantiacus]MBL0422815.1 hypothetical protein [Ramlibacter aurantiacus]
MRNFAVLVALAVVLSACGGGGGNPGQCLGSPAYCAEHASGSSGGGGTDGGLTDAVFTRSGTGDTVFDLPTGVSRLRIEASYGGSVSNFIVQVDNNLVVNVLIGESQDSTTFSGTYAVEGGAQLAITNSTGVAWTMTEVR